MSKGQADIMGLVVIVFLIVVIGMFSLFFVLRGDSMEERDVYYSVKSYNFLNAISKYSNEGFNFKDEVMSCCWYNNCDNMLSFIEDQMVFIEENMSINVSCMYGDSYVIGDCLEGINSEPIVLYSGDEIFSILCRK